MTKLENPRQFNQLLEVFGVDTPQNLPSRVTEVVSYLRAGLIWARRHLPEPYEEDARVSINILLRLRKTFEKCQELPEVGMVMRDKRGGYEVNVFPIIEFITHTESDGKVSRNFDTIQTLLRHYIHADNIQEYKRVGQFIQDIETALYEYQNE
jgi:hypothetical protein